MILVFLSFVFGGQLAINEFGPGPCRSTTVSERKWRSTAAAADTEMREGQVS
jgi:hypothetical protein